jgi:hypothetical protein
MPRRIRIPERIIKHIRIPVETLRIGRAGHNRIRLDEAAQGAVVVAGIVKVQADGRVFDLPGIAPRGGRGPGGEARSTIRIIAQFRNFATAAICGERRGSQMIAEEVGSVALLAHRHPSADLRTGSAGCRRSST